jgi:hypothetical protein
LVDRPIFREIQWIDDQDGKFLPSPFADTELSKRRHGIVEIVQTLALVLKGELA